MKLLITLFYEFFIIGSVSVGGGLATLPYLSALSDKYDWFTQLELLNMIAIAESTPGAIGVNMASYAGYNAAGIIGGIVATLGLISPALIMVTLIAKAMGRFKENKLVSYSFYGIRPAVAALILVAALEIMGHSFVNVAFLSYKDASFLNILNIKAILLFLGLYYLLIKYKKHPIVYIGGAALVGILIM